MFQRSPRDVVRGGFLALLSVAPVAWSCAAGVQDPATAESPEAGSPDVASPDGATGTRDSASNDGGTGPGNPNGDDAATDDATGPGDAAGSDDATIADGSSDGPGPDSTSPDADAPSDGATHDSASTDAGPPPDTGPADSGPPDAGPPDSGQDSGHDAGQDASPPHDASAPDAADAGGGCGTGLVVVNEVQTSGPNGAEDEWVELFNPQSCPVDISGWTLRHTSATGTTIATVFTAGAGTKLGAGGYGIIAGVTYSASVTPIGTFNTGVLADTGGGVGLYNASGSAAILIDSVGYGAAATNPLVETAPAPSEGSGQSIARIPNGAETRDNATDFKSTTPTPGGAN